MNANARVRRLAIWSIPIAFAVMGLKYIAYRLTGSVALYSDALESIDINPLVSRAGDKDPIALDAVVVLGREAAH